MSYTDISWNTSTGSNVSVSNGTVTGTGDNTWSGNIKSNTTITNTMEIKFTDINTNTLAPYGYWLAGLGTDPFTTTSVYDSVEYAFHKSGTTYEIYESGVNKWSQSSPGSSDIPKIVREGSTIKYYISDTLVYTSTVTTSSDLYAQVTTKSLGSVKIEYKETASSTDSDDTVNAHAHLKPLHVFRRQRDWF